MVTTCSSIIFCSRKICPATVFQEILQGSSRSDGPQKSPRFEAMCLWKWCGNPEKSVFVKESYCPKFNLRGNMLKQTHVSWAKPKNLASLLLHSLTKMIDLSDLLYTKIRIGFYVSILFIWLLWKWPALRLWRPPLLARFGIDPFSWSRMYGAELSQSQEPTNSMSLEATHHEEDRFTARAELRFSQLSILKFRSCFGVSMRYLSCSVSGVDAGSRSTWR